MMRILVRLIECVNDIKSDAMNVSDLEEDKNSYSMNFDKVMNFVKQMKDEGKNISDRKLFVQKKN